MNPPHIEIVFGLSENLSHLNHLGISIFVCSFAFFDFFSGLYFMGFYV